MLTSTLKLNSFRYDLQRYELALEAFKEAEAKLDKNPDWQVLYYLGIQTISSS